MDKSHQRNDELKKGVERNASRAIRHTQSATATATGQCITRGASHTVHQNRVRRRAEARSRSLAGAGDSQQGQKGWVGGQHPASMQAAKKHVGWMEGARPIKTEERLQHDEDSSVASGSFGNTLDHFGDR